MIGQFERVKSLAKFKINISHQISQFECVRNLKTGFYSFGLAILKV